MNRLPDPNKVGLFKIKGKGLFLFYLIALSLISVLPINGSSSSLNHIYLIHIRLDYLGHAALFLPWVPLMTWIINSVAKRSCFLFLAITVLSGLIFGALTEGIQYFLSYRSFNINDLIANLLGVILGIPLVCLLHCFTKSGKPTPET